MPARDLPARAARVLDTLVMKHDLGAFDVAVFGGGNAGLCAALEARQAGATVIVCERPPGIFEEETAVTRGTCGACTTVRLNC